MNASHCLRLLTLAGFGSLVSNPALTQHLQPAGRTHLDTFSSELEGTQFDVINVDGHTDGLGSRAYNQKLSMHRAESVKRYRVGAGRIDPLQGGNTPGTKPIACLQPDRRVEIEMVRAR